MAAQHAGEMLQGRISEIPHLWAGSAVMLSVPRRQMTSATAQGREGGRRQARGQRVQVLLKPLFWSLDDFPHLQEGALTVTAFLFLERIFVATSDLRVILQIKTSPWWLYLLCTNGAAKGGLLVARAKNAFFVLSACLFLNIESGSLSNPQKALFHLLCQGTCRRRFPLTSLKPSCINRAPLSISHQQLLSSHPGAEFFPVYNPNYHRNTEYLESKETYKDHQVQDLG